MTPAMHLRRRLAARLEAPSDPGVLGTLAARAYEHFARARLARPLRLPAGGCVVGVGSAVLGGAGKTPVVQALAAGLSQHGRRVAVLAHGYGAAPERPRRVVPGDRVDVVGDDALVLASALPHGVGVYVAPTRQQGLELAAAHADVVIVDGLLQTRPERLTLSLLVLDASRPWGSGASPPVGDLRAAPEALLGTADRVVLVRDPAQLCGPAVFPGAVSAELRLEFVREGTRLLALRDLGKARVGLLLFVARPHRVRESLLARGIRPVCCWIGADHGAPGYLDRRALERMARRERLDGWLVTPKCATHLCSAPGAPLWVMETTVRLDPCPESVVDSRPCARPTFCMHC